MEQKPKLPKELAEKWIAALESGEYAQGERRLYDKITNTFCCLGVLGCILETPLEKMDQYSSIRIEGIIAGLPKSLNTRTNGLSYNNVIMLSRNNDGAEGFTKKNFKEISNLIKETFEFV